MRIAIFEIAELDQLQHFLQMLGALFPWKLVEGKLNIFTDTHMGEQRVILEYHTDSAALWLNKGPFIDYR
ncbi:hypothetical protein D3C71_1806960 [compost metagenome]